MKERRRTNVDSYINAMRVVFEFSHAAFRNVEVHHRSVTRSNNTRSHDESSNSTYFLPTQYSITAARRQLQEQLSTVGVVA